MFLWVASYIPSVCQYACWSKRVEVKNKFYEIAYFPGVVGLVDGTHMRNQRPFENEADYIN